MVRVNFHFEVEVCMCGCKLVVVVNLHPGTLPGNGNPSLGEIRSTYILFPTIRLVFHSWCCVASLIFAIGNLFVDVLSVRTVVLCFKCSVAAHSIASFSLVYRSLKVHQYILSFRVLMENGCTPKQHVQSKTKCRCGLRC